MTEKIYSSSRAQVHDATTQQIKGLNSNIQYKDNFDETQQAPTQTQTSNKKKYIIVGLVIFLIVIGVVLGVTLGLLLKRNQPGTQPQPEPTPFRIYSCSDFPTDCVGVLLSVQNYIFQTSHDPDQIRAQLQIGRSFSSIRDDTRTNLLYVYHDFFKSVQCLAYNMPDNFSKAYSDIAQLQLTTEESLINYLNMTYSFNSYPMTLKPLAEVPTTCQFNLTRRLRRRYLQICLPKTLTGNFVFLDGNGFSPIQNFRYLKKISDFTSQNSSIHFDANTTRITRIGSQFKDELTTAFFLNALTQFQTDLQTNNQPIPSRLSLLWCLRVFIDYDLFVTSRPADMSGELIAKFNDFFSLKITQSMNNIGTIYNFDIARQIISNYVTLGRKVLVIAHADGAIYANSIYNLLPARQKQSVGLVYTAPYSSNMADGLTNYISNPNDGILGHLTYIASNYSIATPMAANAASKTFDRSIDLGYNHDFRGYLESYSAQMADLVVSVQNRITQPPMNHQKLAFWLAWQTQAVIDLHVFEPNGGHVYSANPTGLGTLEGSNPKVYKVGCHYIALGDYDVKVNYYSGTGPVQIHLTVKLYGQVYSAVSTNLTTVMGSAGNTNPRQIYKVNARLDPATNQVLFSLSNTYV